MKNRNKWLCLALCAAAVLSLLGCGAVKTAASASEEATSVVYEYDGSIISGLLNRIIASQNKVEAVPVRITSAQLVRQGCLIHFDRLAYNPEYERGSTDPEKAYLINEEEKDEQTVIADAYLNCTKVKSPYLDKEFVAYISGKKNGVNFTLYWLDGQVIFLSKINEP